MKAWPKRKEAFPNQINLIPEEAGGYTVLVPLLPGCVSCGETIEAATANAREAIELHIENLAAHKQPIPQDNESVCIFTTLVHVTLPHI